MLSFIEFGPPVLEIFEKKGTSRQRSGKGAKIPTPKTEVGKKQTNNQVLIP